MIVFTTASKPAVAAIFQRDASYAGPACADAACADDDHQLVLGRTLAAHSRYTAIADCF